MVNVLVGDKDENLSVGQKLLGRNLIASLQLMLLAPPVIKDKKKIILFDGKAAVIVMRDFDWGTHRSKTPPKGRTHLWDKIRDLCPDS